jgi:hypothetical protein
VVPVVMMSSTITALPPVRPEYGCAAIAPARFRARSAAPSPVESLTSHRNDSGDRTGRSSARPALRASRTTWSPPRRRAAARALGTGTRTAPPGGARSNARINAVPSTSANGSARSRCPRSLYRIRAVRSAPAYHPCATTGSGVRTATGRAQARMQLAQNELPLAPQPAQSTGRTRSSRAWSQEVDAVTPPMLASAPARRRLDGGPVDNVVRYPQIYSK